MDRIKRAKPSPAMVVALISLFVALSGVAWAANTVGSGDVIDNSLVSQDLKDGHGVKNVDVVPDSLTGGAIKESTLGTVPKAQVASGLVGGTGIRAFAYDENDSATAVTILPSFHGLTLTATCRSGHLNVKARTSISHAVLNSASMDTATPTQGVVNRVGETDFLKTQSVNLVPQDQSNQVGQTEYHGADIVSVSWQAQDALIGKCVFAGTAVAGGT